MPSTAGTIGAGTTLGFGATGGSPTYTAIGELKDVKDPNQTADHYEATHYTSPNLGKEYLFGWKDGGEVDFEFNHVTAQTSALNALIGVLQAFKITKADTHTYTFNGAIVGFTGTNPNKGVCDIKVKVKITGVPVYT